MQRCVIFDFAGVLGRHQPADDLRSIAGALGVADDGTLWPAYWRERDGYDRGELSDAEYWGRVAPGAGVETDGERLARVVARDVASWLHLDAEAIGVTAGLAARGHAVTLLSNAPHPLADAIDGLEALRHVSDRYFSSRLGTSKPDPGIYLTVARAQGFAPGDCVMVDDRAENIDGARRAGLTGLHFTDVATLRADLDALDPPAAS